MLHENKIARALRVFNDQGSELGISNMGTIRNVWNR
jgi:hypothetical protein